MATFAFDSSGTTREAGAPVSAHPAFPAIVAAWFAVLLGVGSLILPGLLIERALAATGLAALVPPAAAPFGSVSRALIALGAAIAGALAGLAIARYVTHRHRGADSEGEAPVALSPRRPISVYEDLGGEDFIDRIGETAALHPPAALADDDQAEDRLAPAQLARPETHTEAAAAEELAANSDGFDREAAIGSANPAGPPVAAETTDDPGPLPFSPPSLARRARGAVAPCDSEPMGFEAPPAARSQEMTHIRRGRAGAQPLTRPANRAETDAALRVALATLRQLRGHA